MKKHIIFHILTTIIIFIVLLVIYNKQIDYYNNLEYITNNPFNIINILGTKITPSNSKRTYNVEVDCTKLQPNNEITSFILKESYQDFKVSVKSTIYNNNKVLIDNYENASNIETIIQVVDKEKNYEQLYTINAICKTE